MIFISICKQNGNNFALSLTSLFYNFTPALLVLSLLCKSVLIALNKWLAEFNWRQFCTEWEPVVGWVVAAMQNEFALICQCTKRKNSFIDLLCVPVKLHCMLRASAFHCSALLPSPAASSPTCSNWCRVVGIKWAIAASQCAWWRGVASWSAMSIQKKTGKGLWKTNGGFSFLWRCWAVSYSTELCSYPCESMQAHCRLAFTPSLMITTKHCSQVVLRAALFTLMACRGWASNLIGRQLATGLSLMLVKLMERACQQIGHAFNSPWQIGSDGWRCALWIFMQCKLNTTWHFALLFSFSFTLALTIL